MIKTLPTFLTMAQAVDALAADFGQYGPQPLLFRKIASLVLGENFKIGLLRGVESMMIRIRAGCDFAPVDDSGLGFYLIHMLENSEMDGRTMAKICSLVFQVSVVPGTAKGKSGVWIKSQMDRFVCKRCGNCCSRLAHVCTSEDLRLWECLGRRDILAWVGDMDRDGAKMGSGTWADPETGKPVKSCPFLLRLPGKTIFSCTIQDVKPRVCQEYPFTRKHACHTGCPGFGLKRDPEPVPDPLE